MVKKPKAVTLDVLGTSGTVDPLAQTFTLSDTGTFSKDMFSVGKDGVTNSPLSHGEISALRLIYEEEKKELSDNLRSQQK